MSSEETVVKETATEAEAPKIYEGDLIAGVEALLFAYADPLPIAKIAEALGITKDDARAVVAELAENCQASQRGVEVKMLGDKAQLRTKSDTAAIVRTLMALKPRRLTQAALETLSIIAYQQPIVKSEIDKLRGVDVAPTIKTLLERNLIKIIGYQTSVGQPALYSTTEEFLRIFGIGSISELPNLRDIKAVVREPGEAESSDDDSEAGDEQGVGSDPVPEADSQVSA